MRSAYAHLKRHLIRQHATRLRSARRGIRPVGVGGRAGARRAARGETGAQEPVHVFTPPPPPIASHASGVCITGVMQATRHRHADRELNREIMPYQLGRMWAGVICRRDRRYGAVPHR